MEMPTRPINAASIAMGHYRTSGVAIAGMGLVGLVAWAGASFLEVPAQVVDRPAMLVTSFVFIAIGAWMLRVAATPWGEQGT